MPVMTTGSFGKRLEPGVKSWYGLEYNQYMLEYPEIFETMSSRKHMEELVNLVGFGLLASLDEGETVEYDSGSQGFNRTIRHVKYGLGFKITQEMIEDDVYESVARQYSQALARSEIQTAETVAANILNNAFSSSYTGADGVELCSAVHPNVLGGTQQNEPSTASDLNEAALESLCITIAKWTDDAGLKIKIVPQKLIIPPDLEFEAERVLKTILRPGTANNDLNAMRALAKIPQGIRVNHFLTDTDAWFLKTDAKNSLIHFLRRPSGGPKLENEFDTETAKFKLTKRESFAFFDWRGIAGSPGA